MTTIHTPASLDEADHRLTEIERVVMARGWERAAILATVVRLPGSGGKVGSHFCSPNEYAERGTPGLRDHVTVRTYVQRWLDANGGTYPAADADVVLPDRKWPPVDKSDAGSRPTANNIGDQLRANPNLAQAAAEALAETDVIKHVSTTTVQKLGHTVDSRRHREFLESGGELHPPRISDRNKTPDEVADVEFWNKVRAALQVVLEAKLRRSRGDTVPGDVAITMQMLIDDKDWDAAAADLIDSEAR